MSGRAPGEDPGEDRPAEPALAALRGLALRVEAARRLEPSGGTAVLRSIVEATVALFGAEAASIALHDPVEDRLVYRVAAGEQGQAVIGLAIAPGEGVAGYVFSTGQPLALSDVAGDTRFGRAAAEQTGYIPRSLVAVPLLDDEGAIGVLSVLDKRGDGGFDLRDVELASVFARQATVAIRASRLERDTTSLLRSALATLATAGSPDGSTDEGPAQPGVDDGTTGSADVEAILAAAIHGLDREGDAPLWALADEIARVRAADPDQLELVREIVAVLARRAERTEARRRARPR